MTVNFTQTSYAYVRQGAEIEGGTYYMTDGWQGDVDSATLYTTDITGETSDKLMFPAGEVTFTLEDNGDGSLQLSWTSGTG